MAYNVQVKQVQLRQRRATRARRGALAALRTQGEAQATVSTRVAHATCGQVFTRTSHVDASKPHTRL